MYYTRSLVAAAALVCITAASCKKDNNPSAPAQSETETLLMNATNDIVSFANQESQDVGDVVESDNPDSTCRTVTYDPSRTVYPHVTTIDFGSGCTGGDGLVRTGKKIITVYANAATAASGTLLSQTTFSDFTIDGVNVAGTVQTYLEASPSPGPKVLKVVANKSLTASDGDSKIFTATSYWTQIEGAGTETRQDDVYQITTNAEGNETLDGATAIQWTSHTDTLHPVIKPISCSFRTQGGLNIDLHVITNGGADFTEYLDYGNGDCDNKATLSINGGIPQEVTLPLLFWPLSL